MDTDYVGSSWRIQCRRGAFGQAWSSGQCIRGLGSRVRSWADSRHGECDRIPAASGGECHTLTVGDGAMVGAAA